MTAHPAFHLLMGVTLMLSLLGELICRGHL